MAIRKKCPQVYWSQTDNEINLIVDLVLDDMVFMEKLQIKYIKIK